VQVASLMVIFKDYGVYTVLYKCLQSELSCNVDIGYDKCFVSSFNDYVVSDLQNNILIKSYMGGKKTLYWCRI